MALAALLFSHLVSGGDWDVTIRGDGPDYWLPGSHQALEISGTERTSEVNRRLREKRRQLLGNWLGWDGYVVICCFANADRRIQWNHCSLEE